AARWPEPDRGRRLRLPRGHGPAHFQFRRRGAARATSRRGVSGGDDGRGRACSDDLDRSLDSSRHGGASGDSVRVGESGRCREDGPRGAGAAGAVALSFLFMWKAHSAVLLTAGLGLSLVQTACGGGSATTTTAPTPPPNSVTLTPVVAGLSSPVDLQATDDSTGRLFVVEQAGTIRILQGGALLATPFLDIRTRVAFGGEMGLLGVAFHPTFAQSRRFYVNYVRMLGTGQIQSVIAEYQISAADANQADPASERILLTVNQPFPNHKGGQLAFGPDKFLYIGLGDGGGEGDPLGNGQNLQTHLGKMLRIDVDHTNGALPYAIPADNPFVAGGGLPEIWAYGLRNPFRFSFDSATGKLFAGDDGQDLFEEVDILQKGGNYGWNVMEGLHCFNPATGCNLTGLE